MFKFKAGDIVKDKYGERYALITKTYSKRYDFVGEVKGYSVITLAPDFRDGEVACRYLEERWEKVA